MWSYWAPKPSQLESLLHLRCSTASNLYIVLCIRLKQTNKQKKHPPKPPHNLLLLNLSEARREFLCYLVWNQFH